MGKPSIVLPFRPSAVSASQEGFVMVEVTDRQGADEAIRLRIDLAKVKGDKDIEHAGRVAAEAIRDGLTIAVTALGDQLKKAQEAHVETRVQLGTEQVLHHHTRAALAKEEAEHGATKGALAKASGWRQKTKNALLGVAIGVVIAAVVVVSVIYFAPGVLTWFGLAKAGATVAAAA